MSIGHGDVEGIVLQDLVRGLGAFRLCEKVEKLLQWTTLPCFRNKIGIAVRILDRPEFDGFDKRRNIIVSVPYLERELGCLRKIPWQGCLAVGLAFTPTKEQQSQKSWGWIERFGKNETEPSAAFVLNDVMEFLFVRRVWLKDVRTWRTLSGIKFIGGSRWRNSCSWYAHDSYQGCWQCIQRKLRWIFTVRSTSWGQAFDGHDARDWRGKNSNNGSVRGQT